MSTPEGNGADHNGDHPPTFSYADLGLELSGIPETPAGAPPFEIHLDAAERGVFESVMDKIPLSAMVGHGKSMLALRQRLGVEFSDPEKALIEKMDQFAQSQAQAGRSLQGMDLEFRWVSAEHIGVEDLMRGGYEYGGNAPTDKSGWVHAGTSVVNDFMKNLPPGTPGVLFVYDSSKLTPVTQADREADMANPNGKLAYMHAKKPLPGLELKDTMVGMIGLDRSGTPEVHPRAQPFELDFSQADRRPFVEVMDRISLQNMFGNVRQVAMLDEARGKPYSESEKAVVDRMEKFLDTQEQAGGDVRKMSLLFRWVSAGSLSVEQLKREAYERGGNPPNDKSGWVHAGTSVVEDFMSDSHQDEPGVLFVYDARLLRSITRAEVNADWADPRGKHAYMHGQAPIEGLEIKDTLVGMVSFGDSKA